MKFYLILCCVLVYCSTIVDSNPITEEIVVQRASENANIPANDTPRLFENADIARTQNVNPSFEYRQPTGHQYRQQWQNNGNYRTYNHFKVPPPRKFNYRNSPNNNWVYSNQPVKVVKPVRLEPEVLDSKDFEVLENKVMSSASVQNRREWTNNEYPLVKPQYYQGPRPRNPTGFFHNPKVHGPGFIRPQYIEPAKKQPIEVVVSKNPIQTIVQEPANNNLAPNLQSLFKSEQVQNVLAKNEKRRGYLIVNPNGAVEQVDEIDEIQKNHPNYVMMNVGDIISNQSPVVVFPTTPLPIDPVPELSTPRPLIAPSPIASSQITALPLPNSPTKLFRNPQWNNPYYPPVDAPNSATDIPSPFIQNKLWPGYKPEDIDNSRFPPLYSTTPVSPALPPLNSNTTPMPNIGITPSSVGAITFPTVNEDAEPNTDDDQPTTEPTVVTEVVPVTVSPDDSDKDNTTLEVPSPITVVPTTPSEDDSAGFPDDTASLLYYTSSTLDNTTSPSDVTTSPTYDTTSPIDDTSSPSNYALTTDATPTTQSSITPDVAPDLGPSIIPVVAPDIAPGVPGDDMVDATRPVPPVYEITSPIPDQDPVTAPGVVDSDSTTLTPIVNIPVNTTPSTKPDNDDDDEIITLSPIGNPTTDKPDTPIATTTVLPPKVSITTIYETSEIVDGSTSVKPPCQPAVDVVPEIDLSSVKATTPTTKPVAWFKTTKSEFMNKLTNGNDHEAIYFMQMLPQPIVQKDTKTTMYPNGTIYEEIIETQWDNKEDQEPKIKKTIKITKP